ncbi:hypothetical protein KOR42_25370 [Thalassoglobus neptunius]|uniref:Bacterial Ig-like domain (Group 2) n=1 Tax=Thalassoglobus neptunius TaxID=1938619 RepID=A0A5C5X8H9_9PLAN|nr:DUF1549 and DUF1553 domain-containing protein [Thalassoglobus neptunius]TWT59148.1 hypothetical protein KOR42_25370 [Thalassoglobus neptunius]
MPTHTHHHFRMVLGACCFLLMSQHVCNAQTPSVDFQNDVQPILTRFGCTSGPCHGKARGQGGFQLSLLGFDSDFDYDAITKDGRGRRVFPAAPDESLLLLKPTGQVPHGGGKRLAVDQPEYDTLKTWIQEGMPRRLPDAPTLINITANPNALVMKNDETHSLTVTAHFDDGSSRDVTRLAAFQSNEAPIASVDETGMIEAGSITGTAAIMARYQGQITVCDITIPRPEPVASEVFDALPRFNFIDDHIWTKLQKLNITPSEICSDHVYLRRVTTDLCGRVPSPDEVQQFLDDPSPDKRQEVVERLIQEPDFADHWANKWMDLLRPNPYRVGIKAVFNYDRWIRERFHQRMPWDQLTRELIAARGSTFRNGAVTLYRDRRSPDEVATLVSQLFLGVRLECAKCHHHPFEKWGQDDFYSFAAFFAKVGRKGRGVSPPISGSEEFIFANKSGSVKHPITGEVLPPRSLWGNVTVPEDSDDPREVLAEWMTSPENELFAQVFANRVWADLMGRGLVEPVDDFRATNPASNQALLTALGEHFRDSGYSLEELVRAITSSAAYQLSSIPNEQNVEDTRNYSRHYRHLLRAEVLHDAYTTITGIPADFECMPPDSSAKQLWTHRIGSLFLDTFGRPDPNQDPPCERTSDSTVVQALHLMNSEQLHAQLVHKNGTAAQLAESESSPQEIAIQMYRTVYGRNPTEAESELVVQLIEQAPEERRTVIEDIMWTMLNTPEFVIQN